MTPPLQQATNKTVTFLDFKQSIYKRYTHAPHLEAIDRQLIAAVRHVETNGREGVGFITIETPPRHGKTVNISRLFPAWFLGGHPDLRMILASYGMTLAEKNSRYARNLIASLTFKQLFPGIELARDSKAVDAWDIQGHEGGMDAVGVGGGVTGKGGHIIIVDDPVKSRQEAESAVYREKVWDWFTDDLFTRREPGAAVIVVATRWHEDDLIGRLHKYQPGRWHDLCLPAIAGTSDPLNRNIGAALWPERFPLLTLQEIKQTMGEYSWSALYQQRPVPAEGGIFKKAWFDPWLAELPPIAHAVRFWDLAMSEKTSADYTVGVKLGQGEDGHYYIMDVARAQLDWPDVPAFMANVILSDGANVPQGIEEKGYMSRAIQQLNQDGRFHGYIILGYPAETDKFTRALPFAAKCGAKLVHILNSSWTQEYIDELASFNKGAHDDQVDASSGAYNMIGNHSQYDVGSFTPATYDTFRGAY